MVSVAMITYNHAPFIAQAIESILNQEMDFALEIVIGEDCSTDTTRDIVNEYAARYPDIIRPLFHHRNLGMARNAASVFQACQGKYIAMLEGDDYWIDKQKLVKQVNFMEREPGCAICHHRVRAVHYPSGETRYEYPPEPWRKEHVNGDELLKVNFIQTCSVLYRADTFPVLTDDLLALHLLDWPIAILISRQGWIGYLDECMAEYRLHDNNFWKSKPYEQTCYYTLEMFKVVGRFFASPEQKHLRNQLDQTWLKNASLCNSDHQPLWSHKVAYICMEHALSRRCSYRLEFIRRAAILGLPKPLLWMAQRGNRLAHALQHLITRHLHL